HRAREPLEAQGLLLGAQVKKDVPAQHDVEAAGMRRLLQYVVDLEAKRAPKLLDRAPTVGAFLEPLDHLVDAKPTLDLELAVGAASRSIDAARGDIGAEDVDRPSAPFLGIFGKEHRQGIGFLACRAAGGPDSQALRFCPALHQ